MAKDKKSFLIYCDIIHSIEHLTNEEKGVLFQHLLEYVNDLNPVLEDRVLLGVWKHIENQLKRDLQKYESVRKRNSENARKRWNKTDTKECDRIPKDAKSTKNADNDIDNDNVTDTVIDKDINNNTSDVKTSKPPIDFIKLLDFINQTQKRTGKDKFKVINESVKKKYIARLKDGYTTEDIKNAIVNSAKDNYHKEQNYKYLTPEFFSRNTMLDKHGFKTDTDKSKSKVSKEDFISNPYNEN